MFQNSYIQQIFQYTMETNYYGVDLTNYECHKLQPDPIFSNYKVQDLHFPIGAIQKGQKPFTQKGIKRIKKRNWKKKQANELIKDYFKPLNIKSPEQICMKALRRQFRQKIAENFIQTQKPNKKQKTPTQIKTKLWQKYRRDELFKLIKENKYTLMKIFGRRMRPVGKSKLPRISRAQIKEALKNYVQPKVDQYEKDDEGFKRRRQRSNSSQSNDYDRYDDYGSSSSSSSQNSEMIPQANINNKVQEQSKS